MATQKSETVFVNTEFDRICSLNINTNPKFQRLSGIICTIGPASRDPQILEQMIEVGMNIARLNLSHGSHEYHRETIKNIRTASKNYRKKHGISPSIAIVLDTRGREIRTGLLEGGGSAEIELRRGETFRLTTDKIFAEKGNEKIVYVNYENITKVVKSGDRIYIDDGLISLICKQVENKELVCTIENGGKLGSRKGINLPGVKVDLPTISEIDKVDLKFGIEEGVDMIFSSFTASAATVKEMKTILGEKGKNIMVVSKIENQEGIDHLDEIIEVSDGLMVERGDLGSEIPIEKVFLAQKAIIARCNKAGKPVICATQMLESMTDKPRPTRAESADVANAILDGADCVMLSGETAKGLYPLECVSTMAKICREAEAAIWQKKLFQDLSNQIVFKDITQTIAIAVVEASIKIGASAIIVITTTGKSAHMISRYRPKCPILAVTRFSHVARQCQLFRGILPVHYEEGVLDDWLRDVDARANFGIDLGKKQGFIKPGEPVIVVTGWKKGTGFTNTMRIVEVTNQNQNICAVTGE